LFIADQTDELRLKLPDLPKLADKPDVSVPPLMLKVAVR
jgi:hypothetical protein